MTDTLEAEVTLSVNVEYEAHGPTRGIRERFGVPLEPDEPAGVEILRITDAATGQTIALDSIDENGLEMLEDMAMDHAKEL